MIQLRSQDQLTELFEKVIKEHLEDMANGRYNVIAKELGISLQQVQAMNDIIKTLEPKPGKALCIRYGSEIHRARCGDREGGTMITWYR